MASLHLCLARVLTRRLLEIDLAKIIFVSPTDTSLTELHFLGMRFEWNFALYEMWEISNEKYKVLGFVLLIVLWVSVPVYKITLVKVLILFIKT